MRVVFVAAASLLAGGLYLDRDLLPYSGTLAMAALLAYAWSRPSAAGPRSRRLALCGLALLTATAAVVDAATGGYGWPVRFGEGRAGWSFAYTAGDDGLALLESCLLATAATFLAAAVLARTGRPSWRRLLPAALASALVAVMFGVMAWYPKVDWGRQQAPDPVLRTSALLVPAAAVIVVMFAANAVLAAGRRRRAVGAALLPLLVLSFGAMSAVADNKVIASHNLPMPDAAVWWQRPRTVPPAAHIIAEVRIGLAAPPPPTRNAAPPAPESSPDVAIPGPALWPASVWPDDDDWDRAGPVLRAESLLLGLVALVTFLFRTDPEDWVPLADRS